MADNTGLHPLRSLKSGVSLVLAGVALAALCFEYLVEFSHLGVYAVQVVQFIAHQVVAFEHSAMYGERL